MKAYGDDQVYLHNIHRYKVQHTFNIKKKNINTYYIVIPLPNLQTGIPKQVGIYKDICIKSQVFASVPLVVCIGKTIQLPNKLQVSKDFFSNSKLQKVIVDHLKFKKLYIFLKLITITSRYLPTLIEGTLKIIAESIQKCFVFVKSTLINYLGTFIIQCYV